MPEDYKPQKHEFGTPASAKWAKSMTPGQEGTTGIPNGKTSMKFKDVRPKKEKVEETVSGRSFFQYREDLFENVNPQVLLRKIKYDSIPKKPSRRVSANTRNVIKSMKLYGSRNEASRARGLFTRGKEVSEVTLPLIVGVGGMKGLYGEPVTKLFIRELKVKNGYAYFFSFNGKLPHMHSSSDKKIPKRDWDNFADEYQYTTYLTFGKYFVNPEQYGVEKDTSTDMMEMSLEEIGEMIKSENGALAQMVSSYIEDPESIGEFLASLVDSYSYEIRKSLKESAEDGMNLVEEAITESFDNMLKGIRNSKRLKFLEPEDQIQVRGGKIPDKEFLKFPWFKEYLYTVEDSLSEYMVTSDKPFSEKDASHLDLFIRKTLTRGSAKAYFDEISTAEDGNKDFTVSKEQLLAFVKLKTPDDVAKKVLSFSGFDKSYVAKKGEDMFDEKVKGYKMKGSGSIEFSIQATKRAINQHEKWVNYEDGSIIGQTINWRSGDFTVLAPSAKELAIKLVKDDGFDERKWDGYEGGSQFDGDVVETWVIKGPDGILPDTEAYEDWEEKVIDDGEDLADLGYEGEQVFMETEGALVIQDEDGNEFAYDPYGELSWGDDDIRTFADEEEAAVVSLPQGWKTEPPKVRSQKLRGMLELAEYEHGHGGSYELDVEIDECWLAFKDLQSAYDYATMAYGHRFISLSSSMEEALMEYWQPIRDEIDAGDDFAAPSDVDLSNDEILRMVDSEDFDTMMENMPWEELESSDVREEFMDEFIDQAKTVMTKHANPYDLVTEIDTYYFEHTEEEYGIRFSYLDDPKAKNVYFHIEDGGNPVYPSGVFEYGKNPHSIDVEKMGQVIERLLFEDELDWWPTDDFPIGEQ